MGSEKNWSDDYWRSKIRFSGATMQTNRGVSVARPRYSSVLYATHTHGGSRKANADIQIHVHTHTQHTSTYVGHIQTRAHEHTNIHEHLVNQVRGL